MIQFNAESVSIHTVGALVESEQPTVHTAYVGLDVHKETTAIAVAEPRRQEPAYEGEIANTPKRFERKIQQLSERYGGACCNLSMRPGPVATACIASCWPAAMTSR